MSLTAARVAVALAAVCVPLSLAGVRYGPLALDWLDADGCAGCHRRINPGLVDQWAASAHLVAGVGCADCHGTDHDAMFGADGDVSSRVCAGCHPTAYEQMARSGHARAGASAEENARFQAAPEAIARQGCMGCHAIGRTYPDGGQGRCNDCHSGHRFSAAEARSPAACEGCHMGPDHPQAEAWRASKHGIVFAQTGDAAAGPTCVTCHLPPGAGHDVSRGLGGATDAEARRHMVATCRGCHAEGFALRHLRDADEVKRLADGLVAEAATLVRGLAEDGLLDPAPADRPPHPRAGHALVLGGDQLYSDTSAVEQRFFRMAKFHHAITVKGTHHGSPDHTHWLGYVELQDDLTFLRDAARRLRAEAGHGR